MKYQFPVTSKKLKHGVYLMNVEESKLLDTQEVFAINGYDFADRLLEDVYFYAKISEDRKTIELFDSSANNYIEGLNAKKWIKVALDTIVQTIDNDSSSLMLKSNPSIYIKLLSEEHAKQDYPHLFTMNNQVKKKQK